jgi:hypothetical protein
MTENQENGFFRRVYNDGAIYEGVPQIVDAKLLSLIILPNPKSESFIV